MAKRLIDATEAKEWAEKHILDAEERYTILDFLRECSTVDAVEVVRCRDCVHYELGVCLKIYSDGAVSRFAWQERHQDDFCSYGERRCEE